MQLSRIFAVAMLTLWGSAALADDDKHDLCAERPGLTTNECVIEPGHVQLETGLVDWTLERDHGDRTDTILYGDTIARIGVADKWEVRIGWTPYGTVRDSEDGSTDSMHRVGDVTIGLKRNLIDAKDSGNVGLSLAVIPFATLPVGRMPVGDGTWSAGAELPVGYRIDKLLKFELTPEIEAAPDKDGHGRHLLASLAFGPKFSLSEAVSLQTEIELIRDDDPDPQQRGLQAIGGLSLGVQPDDKTQLDLGSNIGLDRKAPDVEVYAGVTRYF